MAILAEAAGARAPENAAERMLRGRTGVLLTHRFSQAALADRILVLDEGRVVKEGRHEDLVRANGCYACLCAAWSAERTRPWADPVG